MADKANERMAIALLLVQGVSAILQKYADEAEAAGLVEEAGHYRVVRRALLDSASARFAMKPDV